MPMTTDKTRDYILAGRTPEEFFREHEIYAQSSGLLHSLEVAREYGGNWMATHGAEIVIAENDRDVFLKRLDELQIPHAEVAIGYVAPPGTVTY